MSEIQGIDNKKYKPYENTGIEEGDTIISVNNNNIGTTEELIEKVNKAIEKEDVEEIKASKDKLLEKANAFASKVYEEAAKANQSQENTSEETTSNDDNVVDADYEEK